MLVLIPSNKIENTLCWIIFNPYIIAKQTNKQKKKKQKRRYYQAHLDSKWTLMQEHVPVFK